MAPETDQCLDGTLEVWVDFGSVGNKKMGLDHFGNIRNKKMDRDLPDLQSVNDSLQLYDKEVPRRRGLYAEFWRDGVRR